MLANVLVVIILQDISVSNQHIVGLLHVSYSSVTGKKEKKKPTFKM